MPIARGARTWGARLGVLLAGAILPFGVAPAAFAQSGTSTPGVTVTAQNPGTSSSGSDLRITLTAHSAKSSSSDASCRPEDQTLRCWGSLVLRVPDAGGLSLSALQVHRVSIGDVACGGCGGDESAATPGGAADEPDEATVNGLASVGDPGDTGMATGTTVQVKIALVDNGGAHYRDQVDVAVFRYVEGPRPLVYDSGWQTVEQVAIHQRGGG